MKYSILIITTIFCSCGKKNETIRPSTKTITESVYASGIIVSKNQYNVYATVNGIVEKVLIDEGSEVTEGTMILTIINDEQRLLNENAILTSDFNALNSNKGKLEQAQALIELAKNKMESEALMLKRQNELWAQSIGSKVDLEQRELSYQNAITNFESAKQNYVDLKKQLNFQSKQAATNLLISKKNTKDYSVRSKLKGKLYQLNIAEGEIVTPQVPLAIIGDDKKFILEMQVDEYDIVNIDIGMKVVVVLNSYKDSIFNAVVTKINPIMNVQSKTFTIEAEFVNQPDILYPNISFEANILLRKKDNALLIPRNYLINDSIATDKSGKKLIVKTGLKDYQMIEIISGVDENTELIKPK